MRKLNSKFSFVMAAAATLSACQLNPFEDTSPDRILRTEPRVTPTVVPYALVVPRDLELVEGLLQEIPLQAFVPEPGEPIIEIVQAPVGARFTRAATGPSSISWNPPYDIVDSAIGWKRVSMTLRVRSTLDRSPVAYLEKEIDVIVRDSTRTFEIAEVSLQATEGTTLTQNIAINSADFPNGPFLVWPNGLPEGVKVAQSADKKAIALTYTPSALVTKKTDSFDTLAGNFYKDLEIGVVVEDPTRRRTDRKLKVRVYDQAIAPSFAGPAQVTQGRRVQFNVSSQDMNGEAGPKITLLNPVPFGNAEVKNENLSGFRTDVNFVWENIPEDKYGETVSLTFVSCVVRRSGDLCTPKEVIVNLKDEVRSPPTISRTMWPASSGWKYMVAKKTETILIPIGGVTAGDRLEVTIENAEMAREFSWDNGVLTLAPTIDGMKMFTLVARTRDGRVARESFAIDVLPENWSDTLLLGSHHQDADTTSMAPFFPGFQYLNPMQDFSGGRSLAMRNTLILGTSALLDTSLHASSTDLLNRIPKAFINSPLIGRMGGTSEQILMDLGVRVLGRMQEALPGATVGQLPFVAYENLTKPRSDAHVKLQGTLTRESFNPAVLQVTEPSNCKTLLAVRYIGAEGDELHPVAVACSKQVDGIRRRVVISGFEWGDLKAPAATPDIVKDWIRQIKSTYL